MSLLTKILILGTAATIQGIAMATFLFPHLISSGGAASIGVLFHYILNVPFAITLWVLNAGLLLAAVKWLGLSRALWTMYCVSVTSATINIISPQMTQPVSNVVIDLMIGSIIFGFGIGILFKMGASSGGMDILALILSKTRGIPPGKALFVINGSILLFTGLIVDWKIVLYGVACQFIGTRILDVIYKVQFKPKFNEIRKAQSVR
jgi:uncharacterized membrane-anchored protein YitT (DUF2179 family)